MAAMTEQERKQKYASRHHEECLARHRVYMREMRKQSSYQWTGRRFEVVEDPRKVDDGGFRKGSQFSASEVKFMLAQQVFDDGTRVKDLRSDEEFVITKGAMVSMARVRRA